MATPTNYTPKRLVDPAQLTGAYTILYTSPASPALGTQVTSIKLVNTGTAAVTATLNIVKSGGAVDTTTMICDAFSVPPDGLPYEILTQPQAFYLNASDTIRGLASTTAIITYHMSGVELA